MDQISVRHLTYGNIQLETCWHEWSNEWSECWCPPGGWLQYRLIKYSNFRKLVSQWTHSNWNMAEYINVFCVNFSFSVWFLVVFFVVQCCNIDRWALLVIRRELDTAALLPVWLTMMSPSDDGSARLEDILPSFWTMGGSGDVSSIFIYVSGYLKLKANSVFWSTLGSEMLLMLL